MIVLIIVSFEFDSHKLTFEIYGTTGFQTNCNTECLCIFFFFFKENNNAKVHDKEFHDTK